MGWVMVDGEKADARLASRAVLGVAAVDALPARAVRVDPCAVPLVVAAAVARARERVQLLSLAAQKLNDCKGRVACTEN